MANTASSPSSSASVLPERNADYLRPEYWYMPTPPPACSLGSEGLTSLS